MDLGIRVSLPPTTFDDNGHHTHRALQFQPVPGGLRFIIRLLAYGNHLPMRGNS